MADSENVQVYARVRPSTEAQPRTVLCIRGKELLLENNGGTKAFAFDALFGEDAAQKHVFDDAASRIVRGCLDGYNGTIFAYGQTGSGKTHTMIGPTSKDSAESEHEGIIPRSIQLLFQLLEQKQAHHGEGSFTFDVTVSFVELYNEATYDLLAYTGKKLQIRGDQKIVVMGLKEEAVDSCASALKTLESGRRNRFVAETSMNRQSSRSHAIVIVKNLLISRAFWVATVHRVNSVSKEVKSCLNLVDLAGSERVSTTNALDKRFKEATHINKSLTVLGIVIRMLTSRQQKKEIIPYRDSVLTRILKESLGGNFRTAFIINVHPDLKYHSETKSTLLFSEQVREVKNKVTANEDRKGDSVQAYLDEIQRLEEELTKASEEKREEKCRLEREIEKWREAAASYEEQLVLAQTHHAKTPHEREIPFDESMYTVDDSGKRWKVKMSRVKNLQERINKQKQENDILRFVKDEAEAQLGAERKKNFTVQFKLDEEMKAHEILKQKYNRLLEQKREAATPAKNAKDGASEKGGPETVGLMALHSKEQQLKEFMEERERLVAAVAKAERRAIIAEEATRKARSALDEERKRNKELEEKLYLESTLAQHDLTVLTASTSMDRNATRTPGVDSGLSEMLNSVEIDDFGSDGDTGDAAESPSPGKANKKQKEEPRLLRSSRRTPLQSTRKDQKNGLRVAIQHLVKPKQNQSAFMLFYNATRASHSKPGVKAANVAKAVSAVWRKLEDKSKWDKAAARDKKRYEREKEAYQRMIAMIEDSK